MYGEDLQGDLIGIILEICGTLQAAKQAVVSNTASATFQQVIFSVFEKVAEEDCTLFLKAFMKFSIADGW